MPNCIIFHVGLMDSYMALILNHADRLAGNRMDHVQLFRFDSA